MHLILRHRQIHTAQDQYHTVQQHKRDTSSVAQVEEDQVDTKQRVGWQTVPMGLPANRVRCYSRTFYVLSRSHQIRLADLHKSDQRSLPEAP